MKLKKYLRTFLSQKQRTKSTINQYWSAYHVLERYTGRPPKLKDLSDRFFNEYIDWLLDHERSPATVNSQRGLLLAAARGAFDDGVSKYEPRKVKSVRVPDPIVEVWTPEEMKRLILAARELRGRLRRSRYERAIVGEALIALAWDTGLRRSDLHLLRMQTIRESRVFTITQQKSKTRKVCRINESTQDLFALIGETECGYALPRWSIGAERLGLLARQVMLKAGLSTSNHQVLHKIRKSSITHIESIEKGAGWIHGGHSDAAITQRHYIAAEHAYSNMPVPVSIVGKSLGQPELTGTL